MELKQQNKAAQSAIYLHKSLLRKCVFPQNTVPFVALAAAIWSSQTRLVVRLRPPRHSGITKGRPGRLQAPLMFAFQMKPQEKAFFTDPMKLIQSRMEQISKVCLGTLNFEFSTKVDVTSLFHRSLVSRGHRWRESSAT